MDSPKSPSLVRRLRQRHHWLDHLARAAARYTRNHGDHYAAAITYFSVLALVPLLLIGFSALGFVLLAQPDLVDDVRDVITGTVPPGLDEVLVPLVDTAVQQRTAVGVIGLLGAAYTGLGWIGNLREALTAQWEQRRRPGPFLRTRVFDVLALFGLGIALLLSLGLTAAGTAFATDLLELVGLAEARWARALLVGATVLLALAGNWLVFVWVVARLPREPVTLPARPERRCSVRSASRSSPWWRPCSCAASVALPVPRWGRWSACWCSPTWCRAWCSSSPPGRPPRPETNARPPSPRWAL